MVENHHQSMDSDPPELDLMTPVLKEPIQLNTNYTKIQYPIFSLTEYSKLNVLLVRIC